MTGKNTFVSNEHNSLEPYGHEQFFQHSLFALVTKWNLKQNALLQTHQT